MNDRIVITREDGTTEIFEGGKAFVEAVAKAGSAEELGKLMEAGGIHGFDREDLEESYRNLALSQNWDAVREMFEDKDYDSCLKKLEAQGITTTREEFNLINEVIATATDDALVAELRQTSEVGDAVKTLRRRGYCQMDEAFLLMVRENALHLQEDALLTPEELQIFSGSNFYERCRKSINLIFALSSIAGLALGVSGVAEPAMLIAIAGGVSLVLGEEE